ncbi:HNH endonuclease [Aureisphaera sp. CAU 1614]|uniref:HNH endonuclease n=1 Tax=Halomarinibacterium sedimenti TaxID=2857106 RepID=A0A9X1JVT3_9FLAO|nr:HNH endonuclease [Halomarinibacterium sedimenti]MBW2938105.1 HNH endonuclease [Halomarinibacterium sedimenti]
MFAISPTDINWFKFLKNEGLNNEVNFWTPTPWNVSRLASGDRLYFMLKSPIRKIGGYGQFLDYKNTTVNQAWNEFGLKNGCASKKEFTERLDKYKSERSTDETSVSDSEIGCIVLTNAVFFDEDAFLDLDNYEIDFSRYIVKIKYYNSEDPLQIQEQAMELPSTFELLQTDAEKLKKARLVTERKGQGIFRAKLTLAYNNKCCITGEDTPELLEAAHIQPYIDKNSNHVKNGLLLRVDFHKIYDSGLMYIDDNYKIHISPHIESEFYRRYNGKEINLPNDENLRPSKEALMYKQFEFRNE